MNKIFTPVKCLFTSIFCAFLGVWAGAEGTSKNWRRFLIPFALSGLAYGHLHNWWVITIMTMMGAFSMGYGIPSISGSGGSSLGKFWFNFFSLCNWHKRRLLTNIFTRGIVAFMVNLSLLSIPIIKGNFLIYFIGCLFIKLAYTTCSWRDLGGIWIKGKYLLLSDIITYGMIGIVTSMIVYF